MDDPVLFGAGLILLIIVLSIVLPPHTEESEFKRRWCPPHQWPKEKGKRVCQKCGWSPEDGSKS